MLGKTSNGGPDSAGLDFIKLTRPHRNWFFIDRVSGRTPCGIFGEGSQIPALVFRGPNSDYGSVSYNEMEYSQRKCRFLTIGILVIMNNL